MSALKTAVQELSPARVRLTIEVPFDELEYSAEGADPPGGPSRLREFALGFTDGRFEREALPPAFVTAVSAKVRAALGEHGLVPLRHPEVEIVGFGDGLPLTARLLVDKRPRIVLPPLSTLEIEVPAPGATAVKAWVDEQLERIRREFVDLVPVDRPVRISDVVRLDLRTAAEDDGARWEPAGDMQVEVGSEQVLYGLNEALVGLEAGGTAQLTVHVPSGPDEGRQAQVIVTVTEVMGTREPALDDELAAAAGPYANLAELRAGLRNRLARDLRAEQIAAARDAALAAVVRAAGVEAPREAVHELAGRLKAAIAADQEKLGSSLERFLEAEGWTEARLDERLAEQAARELARQIVLDTIADAEGIQINVDELRDLVAREMDRVGVSARTYRKYLARNGVAVGLYEHARREKALIHLLTHVAVKSPDGSAVDLGDIERWLRRPGFGEGAEQNADSNGDGNRGQLSG